MSTVIQLRRGTQAEADALIGYEGELFLDLDNQHLRYHDGVTQGGNVIGRLANTLAGYDITDAYTKIQTNSLLSSKADASTTIAGYGITDAYTRAEVDGLIGAETSFIESSGQITSIITLDTGIEITGDLIPTADSQYDLGSPNARFKDLYISGNSADVGGGIISYADGKFSIPLPNPVKATKPGICGLVVDVIEQYDASGNLINTASGFTDYGIDMSASTYVTAEDIASDMTAADIYGPISKFTTPYDSIMGYSQKITQHVFSEIIFSTPIPLSNGFVTSDGSNYSGTMFPGTTEPTFDFGYTPTGDLERITLTDPGTATVHDSHMFHDGTGPQPVVFSGLAVLRAEVVSDIASTTAIETLLLDKANLIDVYDIPAIDGLLSSKADSIDVYTKTEADLEFYSRPQIDSFLQPTVLTPPVSSVGSTGDAYFDVAVDANYFYFCTANYDGTTDIWHRISWTDTSW